MTKKHCKNPPAHTQKVLYKHVTVVYAFTTEGVCYGQGGAWKMWSNMTDKLKALTAKKPFEGNSDRGSAIICLWWGCPPFCDVSIAAKNSPGESHMGELQGQMRLGSWAYGSRNCRRTLGASVVCHVRAAAEEILTEKFRLLRKDERRQITQKKNWRQVHQNLHITRKQH